MVRVEQQRPRRCNTPREVVRRWATTSTFRGRLAEKFLNVSKNNNDTTEQYDFRQRSASRFQFERQPNCLGCFVVHTFQGTPRTRAALACCASMHGENETKFDIQGGRIKRTRTTITNITHYETYIQLSRVS